MSLIGTTGCFTPALWKGANQTRAVHPAVAGMVRNDPHPGDRALVVRYHALGDGTPVDLVVPLTADGEPVAPFQAVAPVFSNEWDWKGEVVVDSPPNEQGADLRASAAGIAANRPNLARHLGSADWMPIKVEHRSDQLPRRPDGVCVLAYRFTSAGRLEPVDAYSLLEQNSFSTMKPNVARGSSNRRVLPGRFDHLLLVPVSVDRPPGDQGRNVAVAAALTPLAVVGDGGLVCLGVAGVGVVVVTLPITVPLIIVLTAVELRRPTTSEPVEKRPSTRPIVGG